MPQYLLFQLYGPLASWGEPAVGEVRHTAVVPSRSALLGLLAAALGIRREEEDRLNLFNQHYHFAVCPRSLREQWLHDYHTVQVPKVMKKQVYLTRRDELTSAAIGVGTTLSSREYRCDAYYYVAIAATQGAPYNLAALAQALAAPVFPLYLGRKACPPALPLAPQLVQGSLAEVLLAAERLLGCPELVQLNEAPRFCYWDGPAEQEGIQYLESHLRMDQPVSRRRWQFSMLMQHSGSYGEES